VAQNTTWQDAFQFGVTGDTSWSFTSKTFLMEVKASADDVTPKLTLSTGNGYIVVDDAVARVLHFNVPDTILAADLPVARYVYDLIMLDDATPPVRTMLMRGHVQVGLGVTGDT
jgi:hypothetical protein